MQSQQTVTGGQLGILAGTRLAKPMIPEYCHPSPHSSSTIIECPSAPLPQQRIPRIPLGRCAHAHVPHCPALLRKADPPHKMIIPEHFRTSAHSRLASTVCRPSQTQPTSFHRPQGARHLLCICKRSVCALFSTSRTKRPAGVRPDSAPCSSASGPCSRP